VAADELALLVGHHNVALAAVVEAVSPPVVAVAEVAEVPVVALPFAEVQQKGNYDARRNCGNCGARSNSSESGKLGAGGSGALLQGWDLLQSAVLAWQVEAVEVVARMCCFAHPYSNCCLSRPHSANALPQWAGHPAHAALFDFL